MLKQVVDNMAFLTFLQPPSGGCVLKPASMNTYAIKEDPAAFRRLCVETFWRLSASSACVPAAFRRLCVETYVLLLIVQYPFSSRLQAAVC